MTKTPDEIGSYLKMIGRVPLLKEAEEVELGQQVKRMMVCLEKKEKLEENCSVITDEEWAGHLGITKIELDQILKIGQRAKDKMVKANLRLVVSIVKKYLGNGLEFLDLVQEGTVGLMRAVEKFEVDKGYKFSTYAYHWIRQALTRAIGNQSRMIRLPIHVDQTLFKLRKKRLELRQKLGRLPTPSELSKALDLPLEKIRFLHEISCPMLSLEQPGSPDSELTLGSLIIDPKSDVTDFWETLENQSLVEKLLLNLTPVEQKVIKKYYLQTPPLSLTKISQAMKVSRETVHQIKKKALKKLSDSISLYLDIPSDSVEVKPPFKSVESEITTMLKSDESEVVLQGLIKATGCTPSQLFLGNIFEVRSDHGEAQLFLKQGLEKQKLPNLIEGELILQGISKLRKSPSIQDLLKLTSEEIEHKLIGKISE